MPSSASVLPNQHYFKSLADTSSALAKRLHVHIKTARKLRNGEHVRRDVIEDIARKLGVSSGDLVLAVAELDIPDSPEFFEKLEHGYYIELDSKGCPRWHHETIKLKRTSCKDHLIFRGKITNDLSSTFEVSLERISDIQCSLVARFQQASPNSSDRIIHSFCASFSLVLDNSILCGMWLGVNPLRSKLAVYRMLLSPRELTVDELIKIHARAPIELFVKERPSSPH